MARFLPEYKEVDIRPAWEKTAMTITIVVLFLLVPTTVLGYFAESSLPGQILYPMKRGIESMVLLVESITPYKKSQYYQTLASKRVNETATIVAQAEASGDFSSSDVAAGDIALTDIVVSVKQAAKETQTISNPQQKQQAQQQLATSIKNYQTQLTQIHYTIQQHIITPTPTPPGQQIVDATPTPNQQDTSSASDLQDQIAQTQNDLSNITQDLQITPTPTLAPTSTPTTTPKPSPTLTPSPTQRNDHHNENGGGFFHWGN